MLIKSRLHDTVKGNKFQKCVIIRKILLVFQLAEYKSNPGDHKSHNDMKGR